MTVDQEIELSEYMFTKLCINYARGDELTKWLDDAHITCNLENPIFLVVLISFQVYPLDGNTVSW